MGMQLEGRQPTCGGVLCGGADGGVGERWGGFRGGGWGGCAVWFVSGRLLWVGGGDGCIVVGVLGLMLTRGERCYLM